LLIEANNARTMKTVKFRLHTAFTEDGARLLKKYYSHGEINKKTNITCIEANNRNS